MKKIILILSFFVEMDNYISIILASSLIVLILGAIDDAIELGVILRLISQLIASLIVLGSGLSILDIGNYFSLEPIINGVLVDEKGHWIDIDKNHKYGKYGDFLSWGSNGKFDFKSIEKMLFTSIERGNKMPRVPFEVLKRYVYVQSSTNRRAEFYKFYCSRKTP